MKTIAEQCAELGWKIEEILGRSAREIRALGFEISPQVPESYLLRVDDGSLPVNGQRTGYAWVST